MITFKTKRKLQTEPYWDLVYEWEDIFASILNITLCDDKKVAFLNKIIRRIGLNPLAYFYSHKVFYIYFDLLARTYNSIDNKRGNIPCGKSRI
jgi:hypothetical protein